MCKKIKTLVCKVSNDGVAKYYYADAEIKDRVFYIVNVDETHPLSDDEVAEFSRAEKLAWLEMNG